MLVCGRVAIWMELHVNSFKLMLSITPNVISPHFLRCRIVYPQPKTQTLNSLILWGCMTSGFLLLEMRFPMPCLDSYKKDAQNGRTGDSRYPSSTLSPFLFGGTLIIKGLLENLGLGKLFRKYPHKKRMFLGLGTLGRGPKSLEAPHVIRSPEE